jgi:hypothetical protein
MNETIIIALAATALAGVYFLYRPGPDTAYAPGALAPPNLPATSNPRDAMSICDGVTGAAAVGAATYFAGSAGGALAAKTGAAGAAGHAACVAGKAIGKAAVQVANYTADAAEYVGSGTKTVAVDIGKGAASVVSEIGSWF